MNWERETSWMIKILGSHQTDVSSSANTHAVKTAKNWSIAPAMCLVTDTTVLGHYLLLAKFLIHYSDVQSVNWKKKKAQP